MPPLLEIHRPMRSSRISQKFGEDKACVTAGGRIVGKTGMSCPTGTRPYYQSVGLKAHNGLDLPAIEGENVCHSARYGGWMKTEKDRAGGIGVDVVSNEPVFFPGNVPKGMETELQMVVRNGVRGFVSYVKMRYWHLKAPVGSDGKQVVYGQVIGLAGNTGASSAPHLHFAPKWCRKDGTALGEDNGYAGAFDPTPFYHHDIFAGSVPTIPVTSQERKDINSQLSTLTRVLLGLRELTYTI